MDESILFVVVKFRIGDNLRFLSHAETVRVFQRACVRAGIQVVYSKGFNPHPRMSLPLPRSVGVESDDDLLCLRVKGSVSSFDNERFKTELNEQLPEGFELLSVSVTEAKKIFEPTAATYEFSVSREYLSNEFKARIKRLLVSENLNIQRQIDARGRIRNIDVRPFLKSIERNGADIVVECNISSAGAIRVDEILSLLELDVGKLTSPIKRTSVKWQV